MPIVHFTQPEPFAQPVAPPRKKKSSNSKYRSPSRQSVDGDASYIQSTLTPRVPPRRHSWTSRTGYHVIARLTDDDETRQLAERSSPARSILSAGDHVITESASSDQIQIRSKNVWNCSTAEIEETQGLNNCKGYNGDNADATCTRDQLVTSPDWTADARCHSNGSSPPVGELRDCRRDDVPRDGWLPWEQNGDDTMTSRWRQHNSTAASCNDEDLTPQLMAWQQRYRHQRLQRTRSRQLHRSYNNRQVDKPR